MSDLKIFKRKKKDEINGSGRIEFIIATEYSHVITSSTLNDLVKVSGEKFLRNGYDFKVEITDKAINVDKEYTYHRLNTSEQKRFNMNVKDLKRNYRGKGYL